MERELVAPEAGHVRIRVEADGVCHSDAFLVENLLPNRSLPTVPAAG
ncbi:hypothetical protein [Kutzneria sp. NPDC051319]